MEYEKLQIEGIIRTARLRAPFMPSEHYEHSFFNFIYIREPAIDDRLTRVLGLGNWGFEIVGEPKFVAEGEPVVMRDSGKKDKYNNVIFNSIPLSILEGVNPTEETIVYDIPCVMVHGRLSINLGSGWTSFDNYGGDALLNLGKERGTQIMNTYKGAATDALKRVVRRVGMGLYLSGLPKGTNMTNLADNVLVKIGYIPKLDMAKSKFLIASGLTLETAKDVGALALRRSFLDKWGFDDYDMQTLMPTIINVWNWTNGS